MPFVQPFMLLNGAALLLVIGWFFFVRSTLTPASDDFKQYWQAAVNLWQTGDPYIAAPGQAVVHSGFYYPPIFVYIVQPIAWFDQLSGQVFWYWLNALALLALVWLCIVVSGSTLARRYWGLVLLGMCLAPPTWINLQLGQISFYIALLLIGCFALVRQRPALAGLCLTLASLFRIYPMLLGGYFLLRRSWRVALWSVVSGVLLLALSLIYGVGPYASFVSRTLAPNTVYPFAAEHNISLYGFFNRLFKPGLFTAAPLADLPWTVWPLTIAGSLIVLMLCVWAGRDTVPPALSFSLWLCGMMLLSTTNGYYALVLLLFPLLSMLRSLESTPDTRVRALLIVATTLVCVPPGWTIMHPALYQFTHAGWGLLLLTPSLYGLLLYFGLLVLISRRQPS